MVYLELAAVELKIYKFHRRNEREITKDDIAIEIDTG